MSMLPDSWTARSDNMTHQFGVGPMLNTMLNPFARITGSYYSPKAFSRFPTQADPYFNATVFQAGAHGGTYLALTALTRYVMGLSDQEKQKAASNKQVEEQLGVDEDIVNPPSAALKKMKKTASWTGDFMAFALPVAALAVGVSGGYALASKRLTTERSQELDEETAETQRQLAAARNKSLKASQPLQKVAVGLPSAGTLVALAGLGLAGIYAAATIAAKRQFDSTDEARINQKASDSAFKALTRARLASSDTNLRSLNQSVLPRKKALPSAPAPLALPEVTAPAPQETVRPYESVPV